MDEQELEAAVRPAATTAPAGDPRSGTTWSIADEVRSVLDDTEEPGPAKPSDRVGAVYGRWEVRRLLGHGGFGAAYLGIDARGSQAAIKVLTKLDDGAHRRFDREAQLLRNLGGIWTPLLYHHEPTVDHGTQPWMALEFIEGPTLGGYVAHRGPIPTEGLIPIARDLLDAIDHLASRNVAHRDLSPGNVMIDRTGRVRIIDLGMGRDPEDASLSGTNLPGTPGFAAPESLLSQGDGSHVGIPADTWAWGSLMTLLATGRAPYPTHRSQYLIALMNGEPPELDGVDPAFRPAIEVALHFDPLLRNRARIDEYLPRRPIDQLRADLEAQAADRHAHAQALDEARRAHAEELEAERRAHAEELAAIRKRVADAAQQASTATQRQYEAAAERDQALAHIEAVRRNLLQQLADRLARHQHLALVHEQSVRRQRLEQFGGQLRQLAARRQAAVAAEAAKDLTPEGLERRTETARPTLRSWPVADDTIRCPGCGSENDSTTTFCHGCGSWIATPMHAPATPAIDREHESALERTPRHAPCPCGSGKKFKDCHGRRAPEPQVAPEPGAARAGDRVPARITHWGTKRAAGGFAELLNGDTAYIRACDMRTADRKTARRGDTVELTLRRPSGSTSSTWSAEDVTTDLGSPTDPSMAHAAVRRIADTPDVLAWVVFHLVMVASAAVLVQSWANGHPTTIGGWIWGITLTVLWLAGAGFRCVMYLDEKAIGPEFATDVFYGGAAAIVGIPILVSVLFSPF